MIHQYICVKCTQYIFFNWKKWACQPLLWSTGTKMWAGHGPPGPIGSAAYGKGLLPHQAILITFSFSPFYVQLGLHFNDSIKRKRIRVSLKERLQTKIQVSHFGSARPKPTTDTDQTYTVIQVSHGRPSITFQLLAVPLHLSPFSRYSPKPLLRSEYENR